MTIRKPQPQQEHFSSWQNLIEATKTKYTLTFKDACKSLKCSRSWMNKNIRPHVPCVYLSSGKTTDGKRGVNWALKATGKPDAVRFDEKAFDDFVRSSVVSCQKRSKLLHRSSFVDKDKLFDYRLYCGRQFLQKRLTGDEWFDFIDDKTDIMPLCKAEVFETKRTLAKWMTVDIPPTPIKEWHAVHDELEYGDAEETIYRHYFHQGKIKVELSFGEKSKKVYYVDDPYPTTPAPQTKKEKQQLFQMLLYYSDDKDEKTAQSATDAWLLFDDFNVAESAWQNFAKKME